MYITYHRSSAISVESVKGAGDRWRGGVIVFGILNIDNNIAAYLVFFEYIQPAYNGKSATPK